MTNITWLITQLDRRSVDDFVYMAHWQCIGTDNKFYGTVYSTCSWQEADDCHLIPYDELTQDMVLKWIWASGVDKEATEVAVIAQIENQKNLPTKSGIPWQQPLQNVQFGHLRFPKIAVPEQLWKLRFPRIAVQGASNE